MDDNYKAGRAVDGKRSVIICSGESSGGQSIIGSSIRWLRWEYMIMVESLKIVEQVEPGTLNKMENNSKGKGVSSADNKVGRKALVDVTNIPGNIARNNVLKISGVEQVEVFMEIDQYHFAGIALDKSRVHCHNCHGLYENDPIVYALKYLHRISE
ncbi:hypothetical protein LWI28_028493 [Acer negundo]|uniref:Uncharacterized protein n=1 Tax=Acer negundo TaxID=4023 RepID=A0AAD5IWE9_ACENE|nr:hypothetical protein LWI28_028493 [Acer negundo]